MRTALFFIALAIMDLAKADIPNATGGALFILFVFFTMDAIELFKNQ